MMFSLFCTGKRKLKYSILIMLKCILLHCFVEKFDTHVKCSGMECVKIESFLCSPV